jgi:carbamoyl-phosphate synthase large subunit
MNVSNYGTILVSIADADKPLALPLIQRFYDLGFNIEATAGTADYLRKHGVRTRTRRKLNEGSSEIIDALRQGHVSYVINTRTVMTSNHYGDGEAIRRCAAENNVTMLTSLDTVRMLLDVLEEMTIGISPVDSFKVIQE